MEEVEIICDRVIILDKGKVLASGTTDELKELAKIEEKVTVEVNNLEQKYIEKIQKLENVDEGLASKTLKENNMLDESREMIEKATKSYSYDEAFNIINEYVETIEKSEEKEEEGEFE